MVVTCVEASRHEPLWDRMTLSSMEQLRAVRGYKRQSPAYKQDLVKTTMNNKKLKSVASLVCAISVLSGSATVQNIHNQQDFYKVERYGYWLSGLKTFAPTKQLSLCLDAATIGKNNVLNTIAFDCESEMAVCLPPQVLPS